MKTFKEFMESAAEGLAIRASNILGRSSYNRNGLRAPAGGHIPLKQKGHPSSVASAVNEYEKRGAPEPADRKEFPIKSLLATQHYVETSDKDRLRSKLDSKEAHNAHIITHKGKHYIADGHHEIMAARLRGEKTILAKHTDLDKT